jgi:iron complex transport system substrate-binding protein
MTRADPHRIRPARTLALVVALSLGAAACGDDSTNTADTAPSTSADATATGTEPATAEPSTTRPFEHSQGTSQVPTSPERIVTTTDQNALLPLLELGVRPVASAGLLTDDGTQVFRRTEGFDTSGIDFVGEYGEPNAEAIAAQRPDLIVGYEFDSDYYDTLAAIAPTVMIQIFDRPLDEALMDFADLVGRTEQAEQLRDDYQARIDALLEQLGDRAGELSVSVITSGDPGQFYRADTGQALGTVMDDLALLRPTPQQTAASFDESFSVENLADHDADVVLVIDYSGEDQDPGLEALTSSPLFTNLAAARADQIFLIDGTQTVGAAWARMGRYLDELERLLLDPALDVDVVSE